MLSTTMKIRWKSAPKESFQTSELMGNKHYWREKEQSNFKGKQGRNAKIK
jgi:hypothetical protein